MVLSLVVKESPITKNGIARIHSDALKQLGIEPGKNIAVSCGNGSILVHVYADNLIEKNMISLRPGDRQKLKIRSGDTVSIAPHINLKDRFGTIF